MRIATQLCFIVRMSDVLFPLQTLATICTVLSRIIVWSSGVRHINCLSMRRAGVGTVIATLKATYNLIRIGTNPERRLNALTSSVNAMDSILGPSKGCECVRL